MEENFTNEFRRKTNRSISSSTYLSLLAVKYLYYRCHIHVNNNNSDIEPEELRGYIIVYVSNKINPFGMSCVNNCLIN